MASKKIEYPSKLAISFKKIKDHLMGNAKQW